MKGGERKGRQTGVWVKGEEEGKIWGTQKGEEERESQARKDWELMKGGRVRKEGLS